MNEPMCCLCGQPVDPCHVCLLQQDGRAAACCDWCWVLLMRARTDVTEGRRSEWPGQVHDPCSLEPRTLEWDWTWDWRSTQEPEE